MISYVYKAWAHHRLKNQVSHSKAVISAADADDWPGGAGMVAAVPGMGASVVVVVAMPAASRPARWQRPHVG